MYIKGSLFTYHSLVSLAILLLHAILERISPQIDKLPALILVRLPLVDY